MFSQIFTVTAPIFIIVLLGYLWSVWKQKLDTETLSNLVVRVSTPCLVFTTLTRFHIEFELMRQMALAAFLALVLSFAIGATVLRLSGLSLSTFLPSLMHPNSGNIGLPLMLMAFGDEGLALGIAYFVVISISQYTVGYGISAGEFSLVRLLKQPLIYAVIASLVVLVLDLPVPDWISKTTGLLGGIVIPALLMVLGHSLARLKISDLGLALFLTAVRAIMGVVIGLFLVWLLALSGPPAGVVFLMCTMPIAVFNFVFAEHFNRSPEKVAGVIVVSTALTFALLPFLVWVAMHMSTGEPLF